MKNLTATRVDQILDAVKMKEHEVTLDVSELFPYLRSMIKIKAEERGLHVVSTSQHMLIRDLRGM